MQTSSLEKVATCYLIKNKQTYFVINTTPSYCPTILLSHHSECLCCMWNTAIMNSYFSLSGNFCSTVQALRGKNFQILSKLTVSSIICMGMIAAREWSRNLRPEATFCCGDLLALQKSLIIRIPIHFSPALVY